MNTVNRHLLLLLIFGILLMVGSVASLKAEVRIYRVMISSKASLHPKQEPFGRSTIYRGYLIYDPSNPADCQTVSIDTRFKSIRRYGDLYNAMLPAHLTLAPFDRNNDSVFETELALYGFSAYGWYYSRIYRGHIPKQGFRLNGQTFFDTARVIRGFGTTSGGGIEHFRVSNVLRIDPLTGDNPTDIEAGVAMVIAKLVDLGYSPPSP